MSQTTPSTGAVEQELATEQAHVDAVYRQLQLAARSARQVAADGAARYTSDRESYVREEDGTALFERDAFAFQAARRLATLDAEHEGLVFGRLDDVETETNYIGRIGVRDEDFTPLVIDWRARAAEPFYRATPQEPMGIVRRRVLRCRNDLVIGIEDDLLDPDAAPSDLVIVGEGALMAALSRARGQQMRDIVATIQSEQDEAIRAPYQGVTVIAGGPGTGKTVVGLHRTAYLLYSHRRRLENGGVLVVGPSPVFMNYIERVLPSLGEDSVTLRSLGQVVTDVVRMDAVRTDDADAAVLKGSLRLLPVLRRLVAEPLQPLDPAGLKVTVKGEVLSLSVAQLRAIRSRALAEQTYNQATAAVATMIVDALWARRPDDLPVDDPVIFDELIRDVASFRSLIRDWWPPLLATQVLARLAEAEVTALVAGDDLTAAEVATLSASVDPQRWSVADAALLDELVTMLGNPPATDEGPDLFLDDAAGVTELVTVADRLRDERTSDDTEVHSTFAHVLVDEAQDVTPMQWRMLRRRGPQASWTIVGDPAQSSWPTPQETSQALRDLIGTAPHRRFRLSTNYRSPAEVFTLAAAVITRTYPDADLPRAVRSTGIDPELLTTSEDDLPAAIADATSRLLGLVEGTVGVIVPAGRYAAASRVLSSSPVSTDPRLALLTPLEAKGLEYDAVLVVDPDAIVAESSGGERTLYVALTRPTQRLVALDVGGPGRWRP